MDNNKIHPQNKNIYRKEFIKNGYLLVKNVYSVEDINEVRSLFKFAFKNKIWKTSKYNSEYIINDLYRVYPKILDIIINKKYINAVKSLLGEQVIWLPECSVHHNRFINWHKDTTEQEICGINSHKNKNQLLLQCATYFQPNSIYGGGLTVIPGSQYNNDRFLQLYKKGLFNRIKNKISKTTGLSIFDEINNFENIHKIENKIGDLLIFDLRIDHKSSTPLCSNKGNEKYAIFNTFGNNNRFTKEYLDFMKNRPEPYYQYLRTTKFPNQLYKKADSLKIKIWE